MERVVHRFWNVPASLHGPLHCLLHSVSNVDRLLFIFFLYSSAFAQDKTLTWTVLFPVLLYLTKNPIHSSRPNSNASIVAKRCLSPLGTINHVSPPYALSTLFILLQWHLSHFSMLGFGHATLCYSIVSFLGMQTVSCPAVDFLVPSTLSAYSGWPSPKGRCLNHVVATLSLKPRKPRSDLG